MLSGLDASERKKLSGRDEWNRCFVFIAGVHNLDDSALYDELRALIAWEKAHIQPRPLDRRCILVQDCIGFCVHDIGYKLEKEGRNAIGRREGIGLDGDEE